MTQSIKEIKARLLDPQFHDPAYVSLLREDTRSGVKKLVEQYEKQQQKQQLLKDKYMEMSLFEQAAYAKGVRFIAGLDEVGRGPLAGPVVAAAVILPKDCQILGLNDSKQLSQKKRDDLFVEIHNHAIAIGMGVVTHEEIDQINIYQASRLAMKLALEDLAITPEYLLVDAMTIDTSIQQQSLIKGDARSISIAAASIIAKVYRDNLMADFHQTYPYYGFDKNAGYGTKDHLDGMRSHGICPIHRKTFAPVKQYL
ncbi:ribonuclease HII [Candidatus Enterococcus testudinis]|nr:ribonuclease HII [Enterococcus sp. 8G7_MSG3316]